MDCVLHGQQTAPRLPEEDEVAAVEPERHAHLLDLVNETREVPQRRVVGLVAAEGTELVVVVVLDAHTGEPRVEGLVELVGRARATVQEQHLEVGVGADPLGPDAEVTARRADGHHARAARDHVARIPGGGVEVGVLWLSHVRNLAPHHRLGQTWPTAHSWHADVVPQRMNRISQEPAAMILR